MKRIVEKIDRALKDLYNIDIPFKAEDFLIPRLEREANADEVKAGNRDLHGALLVKNVPKGPQKDQDDQPVYIGIYLSHGVEQVLNPFPKYHTPLEWSHEEFAAFNVAVEEVSHFQYLLYHSLAGRSVTQLELEIQGEIDKFWLTYFAFTGAKTFQPELFSALYDQLFSHFHLSEKLSEEEQQRYQVANNVAKIFVSHCKSYFSNHNGYEAGFRLLRKFYRLSASEKLSYISSL